MNVNRSVRLLAWLVLSMTAVPSFAQSTYADEYQNRITSTGTIQPLGATPFGESIDLYTGTTSFEQIDLVLEGNGPAIRIARRSIKGDISAQDPMKYSGFGDWELEIPQITLLVAGSTKINSQVGIWQVLDANFQPTDARCSGGGEIWSPPLQHYGPHTGGIEPQFWSRGMQLEIPGLGSQTVLTRAATAPTPASGVYPMLTNQHWQIGCLGATTSGHPGEAFLVLAPDGTQYHLTQMMFDTYTSFRDWDSQWWTDQPRNFARMKVTQIEDRFGNTVIYHYTGDRLTSITASDGRSVAIEWWADAPLIKKITADGRTWTYDYASRSAIGGILSQVTLPDGSAWTFNGATTPRAFFPVTMEGCWQHVLDPPTGVTSTAVITNPAGVTGTFRFSTRLMAQSYMPSWCVMDFGTMHETANPYFRVSALVQRQISGPGLATAVWNYAYEPAQPSMERECGGNTCQSTIYTDVTDPAGNRTRYIHSTRYGILQGKLLRTEVYANGTALVRAEELLYNYAESNRPYPGLLGSGGSDDPPYASQNIVVLRKTTTTQQGRTFIWEVPAGCAGGLTGYCLDSFGRPTKVVKSSAP